MIRNIRVDTVKLRNKNYKQANKTSIAQIKLNSKHSFEKLISDSSEYDQYICSSSSICSQHLPTNVPGTKGQPGPHHSKKLLKVYKVKAVRPAPPHDLRVYDDAVAILNQVQHFRCKKPTKIWFFDDPRGPRT